MEEIKWSANFAYAVGLITTDGNLSKDGRHLELTSKDIEQLENFKNCLSLDSKISWKTSGLGKKYPRVQFSNVKLYKFLNLIGLHPNKSKTIGELEIPKKFFFDFLRGAFDGDGSIYSYWDKRWVSSFMFYLQFTSSSRKYLEWLQKQIATELNVKGSIKNGSRAMNLVYAKKASKQIISSMYNGKKVVYLSRKKKKVDKILAIENAGMGKLVNPLP